MSTAERVQTTGWRPQLTQPASSPGATARPLGRARSRVRVQVFGELRVSVDGASLCTAGLRPLHRELLSVFCVFADQPVSRDQLQEWFWPHHRAATARHNLQVAVSEVRRRLDRSGQSESTLQRVGCGYLLRLADPADCDARRFEALVRSARRPGVDRDAVVRDLDAAAALYRADLLLAAGYPDWLLDERDRLRQAVSDAYQQLAELRAAGAEHRLAVAAARAGLAHDRHRDVLWRQLVTSSMALGDLAAAADARLRYRRVLADLGVS